MAKERVFKITDKDGEAYGVCFINTFDIGTHQMSCVQLILRSKLPQNYMAGDVFWNGFMKTMTDFLDNNPEDILYFCHRDIPRNLARLRIYQYKFSLYTEAYSPQTKIYVCRGIDAEGQPRHIMFGMNSANTDFDALKSLIEENADRLISEHTEIWNMENSVLHPRI